MSEDKTADAAPEDSLSKEFDDIVAHADDTSEEDGAVEVPVRRDSDAAEPEEEPDAKEVTGPEETPAPEPADKPAAETAPAPVPTPAPAKPAAPHGSGAAMVLQWLSYAFWGWFAVALSWLAGVTVAYFVTGNSSDVTASLAYPLASVIVMFVVALLADVFYAKREPAHKTGGPNAIMLVHVVLFVLIAVAAAVTAVFSLISMLLSTDPTSGTDGQVIACWTSLVAMLAFGMVALRAVLGGKKTVVRRIHWIMMGAFALGFIALSIAGPAMGAQATKDDRLIEEGLPALSQSVREYVGDKGELPATLKDAQDASTGSTSAAADLLVSRNLVRYTPNVKAATKSSSYGGVSYSDYDYVTTTYYYRLCVTYKHAKKSGGTYYDSSAEVASGRYTSYLSIYGHDKGEVCYNLSAIDSYNTIYPIDDAEGSTSANGSTGTTKQ